MRQISGIEIEGEYLLLVEYLNVNIKLYFITFITVVSDDINCPPISVYLVRLNCLKQIWLGDVNLLFAA